MKKIIAIVLALAITAGSLSSCEEWNEVENIHFTNGEGHSKAYYTDLRRWKEETPYGKAWGWFGGWGANSASLKNALRGLPDSLYMAAIWGSWLPSTVSKAMREDMAYVQKVKGTRVVGTTITGWVGSGLIGGDYKDNPDKERLFGWKPEWDEPSAWRAPDGTEERAAQEASIRKYARMIVDSIITGGYDGFDIDYEPTAGGGGCKRELANDDNFFIFVDELGKSLGPKSGSDKLLVIDGEINHLEGRCMPYFDYFIWQAYGYASDERMDSYFKQVADEAKEFLDPAEVAAKFFTTVNFEQYHATGGGSYTGAPNRLVGQALWEPTYEGVKYRKGGFGSYHIEYEYVVSGQTGFYPWTRQAIRAVHRPEPANPEPEE